MIPQNPSFATIAPPLATEPARYRTLQSDSNPRVLVQLLRAQAKQSCCNKNGLLRRFRSSQ